MAHKEPITAHEYTYTVVFAPEPEGGFTVTCPALSGLVSYGETMDDARANAVEAIEGYLESLRMDGVTLPSSEEHSTEAHSEPVTVKLSTV